MCEVEVGIVCTAYVWRPTTPSPLLSGGTCPNSCLALFPPIPCYPFFTFHTFFHSLILFPPLIFFSAHPPPPPSQMDAQTFAMEMASALWARTAGTVSVRLAGGALAAVLPWRPHAQTTRTMKEVRQRGGWGGSNRNRPMRTFHPMPYLEEAALYVNTANASTQALAVPFQAACLALAPLTICECNGLHASKGAPMPRRMCGFSMNI